MTASSADGPPTTTCIPDTAPGAVKGDLETQTGATGQKGDTSFGIVETRDEFDNELGITAPLLSEGV